jgi:catechol 2,3-dioxygenase-like lactoylglutathione lyase family enzyme
LKLDHVSLNVADRPRSIEWYREVLGLEPRGEAKQDDWPVFMGDVVALFQAASPAPERDSETAGLRHFAFGVGAQELKRVKGQLGEKGVRFNAEDHGNAHSVYFRDPDSNTIEFTTYEV